MLTKERYEEISKEIGKPLPEFITTQDDLNWMVKMGAMVDHGPKMFFGVVIDSDGKNFTRYEKYKQELKDFLYMRQLERDGKLKMVSIKEEKMKPDNIPF